MPFTRTVFIIGALALAGIPILNGFWSKELVLEAGLHAGPVWMYVIMLVGAGLTACYTFRMVWLVFYGAPQNKLHPHEAGVFMKTALLPLAAGTLLSWLLAGPLGHLLADSLPFHIVEVESTLAVLEEVAATPLTLVALAVIALGLAAWWQRARLAGFARALHGLAWAADSSFGFEAINRGLVRGIQSAAESLRATQTGLLSWNVLAIIAGLALVLAVLALGA